MKKSNSWFLEAMTRRLDSLLTRRQIHLLLGIATLAATHIAAAEPLLQWPLDDNSATLTVTEDRRGLNGVLVGAASSSVMSIGGKVGRAFNFDGIDDYVNADSAVGTTTNLSEGSISLWLKADSHGGQILTWGPYDSCKAAIWIQTVPAGGSSVIGTNDVVRLQIYDMCNFGVATLVDSPVSDLVGKWHHYVVTVSRTEGTRLYWDGRDVTATSQWMLGSTSNSVGFVSTLAKFHSLHLSLGVQKRAAEANYYFKGALDQVAVWSNALSKIEVAALYGAGAVTVSSRCNIFGAGHTPPDDTPTIAGDGGIAPVAIGLQELGCGSVLTFDATGLVSYGSDLPFNGPDGDGSFYSVPGYNGISGINCPRRSLIGVFVSDSTPTDPPPASLDFSNGGTEYVSVSPLLNQMFFIGDGKANGGAVMQHAQIPEGATKLCLGVVDGFGAEVPGWYDGNTGEFQVAVIRGSTGTEIELCNGIDDDCDGQIDEECLGSIKVLLPASVYEGASAQGEVSVSSPVANDLVVQLQIDAGVQASVSSPIAIPQGQSNAFFTVNGLVDGVWDGDQSVQVTASATGYAPGSASIGIIDVTAVDLIIDNSAGLPLVTVSGVWKPTTLSSGYWGANYLHDNNEGKGAKDVTFTPTMTAAGTFQVFVWHTANANRASNVPIDIVHAGGTTSAILNQRLNGSKWNNLGSFNFTKGTAGFVRLRTTGTDGYVIADAVRFVRAAPVVPTVTVAASDATAGEPGSGQGTGTFTFSRSGSTAAPLTVNIGIGGTATGGSDYTTLGSTVTFGVGAATVNAVVSVLDDPIAESSETVVLTVTSSTAYQLGIASAATVTILDDESAAEHLLVDNADGSGWVTVSGTWTPATTTAGYWGANYLHDGNAGKGSKSVTFTPTVVTAGDYDVFIRYPAAANRASNVPVDIVYNGGTDTRTVNQRLNGGVWNLLGRYSFAAGSSGNVRIRTTGTDGYVMADAVKLVPAGAVLPSVTVTASDASAGEPGSGQGSGTFSLSRTGSTAAALTVNVGIGGTATGGSDYTSIGSTVTFGIGAASVDVAVAVLDDTLAEGSETVALTLASGSGYLVGSPSLATVTIADDEPAPEHLLVDNADGTSWVSLSGSWTLASTTAGYWGANYLHDGNTGKGTKSVVFTPAVSVSGSYDVYIRYSAHANRASNVPVDIAYNGGIDTKIVNERINGGVWNLLGRYSFVAGSSGKITMRTTGTDGYVIADAVALVLAIPSIPEVAVNNPVDESAVATSLKATTQTDSAVWDAKESTSGEPVYPRAWVSGNLNTDSRARNLIDGNTNTLWVGNADATTWTAIVDLGSAQKLQEVDVLFDGGVWEDMAVIGSPDGIDWIDLQTATNNESLLRYLYFSLQDTRGARLPAIQELILDIAQ